MSYLFAYAFIGIFIAIPIYPIINAINSLFTMKYYVGRGINPATQIPKEKMRPYNTVTAKIISSDKSNDPKELHEYFNKYEYIVDGKKYYKINTTATSQPIGAEVDMYYLKDPRKTVFSVNELSKKEHPPIVFLISWALGTIVAIILHLCGKI